MGRGLSPTQHAILERARAGRARGATPDATLAELIAGHYAAITTESRRVAAADVGRAVTRLARRGLLERQRMGRRFGVVLTDAGLAPQVPRPRRQRQKREAPAAVVAPVVEAADLAADAPTPAAVVEAPAALVQMAPDMWLCTRCPDFMTDPAGPCLGCGWRPPAASPCVEQRQQPQESLHSTYLSMLFDSADVGPSSSSPRPARSPRRRPRRPSKEPAPLSAPMVWHVDRRGCVEVVRPRKGLSYNDAS
jgi:hypothetical protein